MREPTIQRLKIARGEEATFFVPSFLWHAAVSTEPRLTPPPPPQPPFSSSLTVYNPKLWKHLPKSAPNVINVRFG